MTPCPKFRNCPYFQDQVPKAAHLATLTKLKYCMGEFTECARYRLAEDNPAAVIPGDLLPYEMNRAGSLSAKNTEN